MAQSGHRERRDSEFSSPENRPYQNLDDDDNVSLEKQLKQKQHQRRSQEDARPKERNRSRDQDRYQRDGSGPADNRRSKDRIARESTSASGEARKRRSDPEDYPDNNEREYDYDPEARYSGEKYDQPMDYRRGGYDPRPVPQPKAERGMPPIMDVRNFRSEQDIINHHENERRRKISSWIITEKKKPSPLRALSSYYHVARYVKDS